MSNDTVVSLAAPAQVCDPLTELRAYPRRHRRGEKTRPATGSTAAGSGDGFGRAQTHRSRSVARSSGQTARYWQGNGLQTRRRYARRGLCAFNVILGTNLPMTPCSCASEGR